MPATSHSDLELPICTKCGLALEDTGDGFVVITSCLSTKKRVYHKDICDGTEIAVLDPLKILEDRDMLLETQRAQQQSLHQSSVRPTIYSFGKEPKMTKKRRMKALEKDVKHLYGEIRVLQKERAELERATVLHRSHTLGYPLRGTTYPLNDVVDYLLEHLGLEITQISAVPEHTKITEVKETKPKNK